MTKNTKKDNQAQNFSKLNNKINSEIFWLKHELKSDRLISKEEFSSLVYLIKARDKNLSQSDYDKYYERVMELNNLHDSVSEHNQNTLLGRLKYVVDSYKTRLNEYKNLDKKIDGSFFNLKDNSGKIHIQVTQPPKADEFHYEQQVIEQILNGYNTNNFSEKNQKSWSELSSLSHISQGIDSHNQKVDKKIKAAYNKVDDLFYELSEQCDELRGIIKTKWLDATLLLDDIESEVDKFFDKQSILVEDRKHFVEKVKNLIKGSEDELRDTPVFWQRIGDFFLSLVNLLLPEHKQFTYWKDEESKVNKAFNNFHQNLNTFFRPEDNSSLQNDSNLEISEAGTSAAASV